MSSRPGNVIIGAIESTGAYQSVAAPEAAPSGASAGIVGRDGCPEVFWYFSGATTATLQPWFYDSVSSAWCINGPPIDITGNEVIQAYQPGAGARHAMQLTAITGGPLLRNIQYIEKDS